MLRKGNLRLLNKNPVENLAISGWLLKKQGGSLFLGDVHTSFWR
jgi:hypothetical protein